MTAIRSTLEGLRLPEIESEAWARGLHLTLVVDVGPSMVLWEQEVGTFITQLEQTGIFRRIRLARLDTRSPAGPVLYGDNKDSSARDPAALTDRSGHRVLLVVTDAVGVCWRRELVSPLLAQWASTMPVALVHLLPQRLWGSHGLSPRRTRLAVSGWLQPNDRWGVTLANAGLGSSRLPDGVVAVPVLELAPRWLRWWARLISGTQPGPFNAAVLLARMGNVTHPVASTQSPHAGNGPAPTPAQLVHRFCTVASPAARRLGSLLAAAPVNLDVARLLQEELVPEASKPELVELLASDLVRDVEAREHEHRSAGGDTWQNAMFDFRQGVRQVLLQGVRRPETLHVIGLLADRLGNDLPALKGIRAALNAPNEVPLPIVNGEYRYFAALEADVLRALGGPCLARADRIQAALDRAKTGEDSTMAQPEHHSASVRLERRAEPSGGAMPADGRALEAVPRLPDPAVREHLVERATGERVLPVWGDIPPRNPQFTGRAELLDRLAKGLSAGGTTAVLPAALHGMGGIGKTQMAVEFVYRHLDEYDLVWWIQAAQVAQVRKALTELAQQLRLPGSNEVHTAVPAVLEALKQGVPHRRWLLVFDAAEDVDNIRTFFPTNGPGHIVVTSRNPEWESWAEPLAITVFARHESVALLHKRDPGISAEDADALAEKLGDLPLAVEQAAAWRAVTGMPVSEYLRLFDVKVAEILSTSAPARYELPVAAAWNVSFDELESRNPAAHQLLQVCAFFAPEPITRNLFTGGIRVSISPALDTALREEMQLGRAIRDINRYSLAKIDHRNNTLQLHRLVQLVLRNRMNEQVRDVMKHGAHMLLANFDPNEPKSSGWWPRYQAIWPHIYASEPFESDDPWVRQLIINVMQFLYFWGDHREAATLAKKALECWSERFGETNSQALEAASYLGLYLWALGEYREAAERNRRTLELRRQISGGEPSEETIIAELRVAVDVRTSGDFMAARAMNEEIFATSRALYGDDDPITLQTAHDLAVSIRLSGDFRAAFELDQQTFERRSEVLGLDKPDTLNTQSGMYMDRRELGDYPRARDEHERMVRRVRELLGEDNANTLRREAYLAVALRKAGDHETALEMSTRALQLFQRRYGDAHPDAMACAVGHAIDLRHAGRLDEARTLGEETFNRYRAKLGDSHPHTQAAAVNLAVTHRLLGEPATARQLNERSSALLRETLGPDHPYSIACSIDLASDLAALGESEAALELGTDAIYRATQVLGEKHPTTLAARLNVTIDLAATGQTALAEARFAEVLEHYRQVLGSAHKGTEDATARVRANCDVDPLPT